MMRFWYLENNRTFTAIELKNMLLKESKNKKKKIIKIETGVVINPSMKDYGNDPFFVKKADKAKETIDKYGLPKF